MIPVLQRIRQSAHATARKIGPPPSAITEPNSTFKHNIVLPVPEPLTPRLLALGLSNHAATRISSAMMRVALLLKGDFEKGIHNLLLTREPSSSIPSAFITIYKRTLQQWTSYLLDDVTPRVLRAQALRNNALSTGKAKRPFNQVRWSIVHST